MSALLLGLSACLELPDEREEPDLDPTDVANLEELVEFAELGRCDEAGWDGQVVNSSDIAVNVRIDVIFNSFGTEEVATGSTEVVVEARGSAMFLAVPDAEPQDLVLSCNIALGAIEPAR